MSKILKTAKAYTTRIASTEEVMAPGEAAQKKSVIGAHNRCWKYLNDVVPSLPMVKQKEALNSLEEIKGLQRQATETLVERDRDW
jgi:hypothetical protein